MSYLLHGHCPGGKPTRTMKSWLSMKQRCFNPNAPDFDRYGGLGITVCERWRNSFANFLADMGERPQGMTLDRVDNEGNYEPSNCRWATESAQQRNTSVSIYLTIRGKTQSIMEWAKVAAVHVGVMRRRYHAGWAHDEVVFRPSRKGA